MKAGRHFLLEACIWNCRKAMYFYQGGVRSGDLRQVRLTGAHAPATTYVVMLLTKASKQFSRKDSLVPQICLLKIVSIFYFPL